MLSCERATFLMSQGQDRPLSRAERYGLALHVSLCAACKAFGAQLPFLRRAARAFARTEPEPSTREPDDP